MIKKVNDLSLGSMGERGFLKKLLPSLVKAGKGRFRVPPGDDAAVLRKPSGAVLSIDGLTEGTHFRSSWSRYYHDLTGIPFGRALGWKLLGGALSDLAAMGSSQNRWAMVYLGAPPATKLSFLQEIYRGCIEISSTCKCVLVGGDTVRANDISLVAAVGAEMRDGLVLTRAGARPGDAIGMAGSMGDASAGLKVMEGKLKGASKKRKAYFAKRMFHVRPLFDEADILAGTPGVSAMIDLSDSLKESIELVCDSSRVGARIEVNRLPVSKPFADLFHHDIDLLTAGEDYALLFTVRPSSLRFLASRLSFSIIGRVLNRTDGIFFALNGTERPAPAPFRHFSVP